VPPSGPVQSALPLAGEAPPARGSAVAPAPPEVELVADREAFARLLAETEAAPVVGLDTETTGLDAHADRLRTIQLATPERIRVVDAWACGASLLRPWLAARARAGRRTLVHNGKFDLEMIRAATGGAPLEPVSVCDVMLWSLLLCCGLPEEGGHALAALALRWLGLDLPKEQRLAGWAGPLSPEQVRYAGRDAWILLPLARALEEGAAGRPGLRAEGLQPTAAVEDACVPAVADMEFAGIGFDLPYWTGLTEDIRRGAGSAEAEALALLGGGAPRRPLALSLLGGDAPPAVNLNSPAQVLAALHAAGVQAAGTSERALRPHAADHPAVQALLRYKRQSKLLGAFGAALPRFVHPATGRIHAAYQQLHRGGSGRLACSGPNIQQIPRDALFRRGFVAGPGRSLIIADLDQIELRVMCRLAGDARMAEAYAQGEDLHRLTASLLLGVAPAAVDRQQRQLAKAANFGLIYAMSAAGLRAYAADSFGVRLTAAEAETFHRRFFEAYAGVAAYHRRQNTEARRAREVRTLLGRARRWPDERMGLPELVNCPAQGTGADILKRAMGLLRPALVRAGAELVASVHDELVVECPSDRAEQVRAEVAGALVRAGQELLHPVPVEATAVVGSSWAQKG